MTNGGGLVDLLGPAGVPAFSPGRFSGDAVSPLAMQEDEMAADDGGAEPRLLRARSIGSRGSVQDILEAHGATVPGPDLDAALADLAGAVDEAREDGFDPPSALALRNADLLLRGMYGHRRCRFEVYPTQDREVAIYALERGRSVLVLCGSDGSVCGSVDLNGKKHCRAYCDPAFVADLPDRFPGFLREALAALDIP